MKKIKVLAGIFAAVTALSCQMSVSGEEYCETLKYIIRDDKAVITGYVGQPEKLVIPWQIEGKEVTEIRENAFYKCESLKSITLPDSIESVGRHAFFQCQSLEQVNLSENMNIIKEGTFAHCTALKEINLPVKLKIIEDSGFYNCNSISVVKNSAALTDIGDNAFAECENLKGIVFSEKLVNIGDYAFVGCDNINSIYIPESVEKMGSCCVGYSSNSCIINNNFSISGKENSIGKVYAKNNNMKFKSNENEPIKRNISPIPGIAMIVSSAGLLLYHFFLKGLMLAKCVNTRKLRSH